MNKTSGPLSVVATTGSNFYLTYLYDKQHILFVDRELCYLYHSFLYLSASFLFDYYCHNYMTSSEVKLNVQRLYKNIKGQMYWIRLLNKYWMMRGTYFHSSRGCHRERGRNQQIMMLENGRFYHSMYLGIL
jgi:hypothetical protein